MVGVSGVLALLSTSSVLLEINQDPEKLNLGLTSSVAEQTKRPQSMTPSLVLPIHPISSSHTKHLVVSSLNVTFDFMALVTAMHLHLLFTLPGTTFPTPL